MINPAFFITGLSLLILPFIILTSLIFLTIFWLLKKFKIIDAGKIKQIFHITKGIILSLLGVLVFVAITQFVILVIQGLVNIISK